MGHETFTVRLEAASDQNLSIQAAEERLQPLFKFSVVRSAAGSSLEVSLTRNEPDSFIEVRLTPGPENPQFVQYAELLMPIDQPDSAADIFQDVACKLAHLGLLPRVGGGLFPCPLTITKDCGFCQSLTLEINAQKEQWKESSDINIAGQSMITHKNGRRDQPADMPSDDTETPAVWKDLLSEYHALVDLARWHGLTPEQHGRLQAVEEEMDDLDELTPEARLMYAGIAETENELNALHQAALALAAHHSPT